MTGNFEKGDRVRYVSGDDPYTELRPGDTGTVVFVDSLGTIHVNWDSGSKLGMVPGHDRIEKVERGT